MNEDLMKKLEVVGENKAFQDALNQVESVEDARKVLDRFGIQMSESDFNEVISLVKKSADELSEESLEGVAGGRKLFGVVTVPAVPITLVNWVFKKLFGR